MRSLPLLVSLLVVAGCASASKTSCPDCEPAGEPAAAEGPGPTGSPEAPPADVAAELKNTLRWKTASEVDNFGFDVYRGLTEDGPFERLTEQPIPGAVTTDESQQYVFEDDTIEPGVEYWYYVESISLGGVREKFTPVFKAKAKGVAVESSGR